MANIVGGVTSINNPKTDYNQTDPNKADYLKNKPLTDQIFDPKSENAQSGKAVAQAIPVLKGTAQGKGLITLNDVSPLEHKIKITPVQQSLSNEIDFVSGSLNDLLTLINDTKRLFDPKVMKNNKICISFEVVSGSVYDCRISDDTTYETYWVGEPKTDENGRVYYEIEVSNILNKSSFWNNFDPNGIEVANACFVYDFYKDYIPYVGKTKSGGNDTLWEGMDDFGNTFDNISGISGIEPNKTYTVSFENPSGELVGKQFEFCSAMKESVVYFEGVFSQTDTGRLYFTFTTDDEYYHAFSYDYNNGSYPYGIEIKNFRLVEGLSADSGTAEDSPEFKPTNIQVDYDGKSETISFTEPDTKEVEILATNGVVTLTADNTAVNIEVEYNRDIIKAITALENAVGLVNTTIASVVDVEE